MSFPSLSKVPRGADATLRQASAWYNALPPEARTHVGTIAEMAAHGALFGIFCVIDGVRVVESTPEKGEFTLTFHKGDVETPMNPPDGEMLHDLLNGAIADARERDGR